ncbi:MAG: MerR family transcriptional regulator [Acidibacillus sp.]|nr:MerR family transcriptional regulator [Acidibacillus sp.]
MDNFYQIGELAKRIGKHVNTVDNWFKYLEKSRVHYVNRASGMKLYDETDLQIALFIRDKRDDNWSMDGITNILPDHFEPRPFPAEDTASAPQVLDMDAIKAELRSAAEEIAAAQVAEVRRQYEELTKRLPEPVDPYIEKQKRIDDMITQRRVIARLEDEALRLWTAKPREERLKSAGLFRRVEDDDKRDRFVMQYIDERLEERLREAYGLDEA